MRPLPAATDVAIIGSGYTGLSAALRLARGGREVTILEQDSVGYGASSRNFGMLGRQHKIEFTTLVRRVGVERAEALYDGCNKAFAFVNDLIERETIDCFHVQSGRFVAANTPAHLEALEMELTARHKHFGHAFRIVGREQVDQELGSEGFAGGAVIPEHRTVHPGLFHNGLADRVRQTGAAIHSGTKVLSAEKNAGGWRLQTNRGPLAARHLIAATNGYTGRTTPWLQRRIVPIRAYMIATEPLDPDLLASILPTRRGFHDCAREMQYARISPDGSPGSPVLVVLVVALIYTPRIARMSRAAVLDIVTRDYITAARLRGEGALSVVRREILPNATGVLLVEFAVRAGYAPVLIGTLGFLGFGLRPPSPEWGLMISEYRNLLTVQPMAVFGPGLMLSTLVIGLNFFTEGFARILGRSPVRSAA